jgi:hypothetical protein
MGQNKSKSKNPKSPRNLLNVTKANDPSSSPKDETLSNNSQRQTQKLGTDTIATNDSRQLSPKSENAKNTSPKHALKRTSSSFKVKRLQKMYEKYKEVDEDYIGPNGIERLCHDLGVEPEDIVMLVLAWHLKAQEMGYFSRDEFLGGLEKLSVDSVDKLKAKLPILREDLADPIKFKEIYRYAFNFMKEDQKSRSIDMSVAVQMLQLLLKGHKSEDGRVLVKPFPHVESFCTFLQQQTAYKVMNSDQWMSFFEFCKTVSEDLSEYDENAAWPVLIDMYVAWTKEKKESPEGAPPENNKNYKDNAD